MRSPGGRYNESNYPVQELGQKRGGGGRCIFEGGVLAGHYSICTSSVLIACRVRNVHYSTAASGYLNGLRMSPTCLTPSAFSLLYSPQY